MLERLVSTRHGITLTILRVMLGIVFFPHGAQKMLGWFGGAGFSATMNSFVGQHIPEVFAFLAIAAEFFGSIGLIVGLLTRVAAFGIAVNMVVAVAKVHWANGFFMNWTGRQRGEGFEFHLLVLTIATVIMMRGAGSFSLDRAMTRLLRAQTGKPVHQ